MHLVKKIYDDLYYVGSDDRRLMKFEGVYPVQKGVSYNSYLLLDKVNVLFDTVDKSVSSIFFENIEYLLNGKSLDYVVVHHMEPDHSGTLYELTLRYPNICVICNKKTETMIHQFFDFKMLKVKVVDENDTFSTGNHNIAFLNAPMVHWPEVMVSYDTVTKTLFSADAFGTFGALNGILYSDEVDFNHEYMDEARRYYTNIVGKYGTQVQAILKKASNYEIKMICPLHGPLWRNNISDILTKYIKWATYESEVEGVMIAYASVYGNTENGAMILASYLNEHKIKTTLFDVSVTHSSEIIANAFKYSHLVFASTTYNANIFVAMEDVLNDLVAHNIQNRKVALIENGSWAPTSYSLMKEKLSKCKNIEFLGDKITIQSSVKQNTLDQIYALGDVIINSMKKELNLENVIEKEIDNNAIFKISYGLYVLTTNYNGVDNGCIINTCQLLTDTPKRISVTVNKENLTCEMLLKSKVLNVSVLTEKCTFETIKHFGFQTGREVNKLDEKYPVSENKVKYINEYTNAYISGKVIDTVDLDTHILFICEVTEAKQISDENSLTYEYYLQHVKPKPNTLEKKKGYVCKICGYLYEGDNLPDDYICPLCKHGIDDFEYQE